MSVNKVIIVGNLGSHPSIKSISNGGEVTNFNVATSEYWFEKETNQKKERTEWHKVSIFGPLAKIAANDLCKGSKVFIEGKIHSQKYEDSSGITRWNSQIIANHIEFSDKQNNLKSISVKEETLCNLENQQVPF